MFTSRKSNGGFPSHTTQTFRPIRGELKPFKPFTLVNYRRGVAHTIWKRMSYAEIVRDVLKDETSSSVLAKVIRGERLSANGWRCVPIVPVAQPANPKAELVDYDSEVNHSTP